MLPRATLIKLCRARDLLRENFQEPLTLADAAAEAYLSPFYFLRLFRQAFGETPHEFLTRVRLERAQLLLSTSRRPVTEVCLDVGFSSLGSFSTLFSRRVGVSPSVFRRQARSWVSVPAAAPWLFVPTCFAFMFGGNIAILKKRSAVAVATLQTG